MSDDAQLALLTEAEVHALAEAEDTIRRGLTTFVEVGQALLRIRDDRLYRAEFPTFEAYCRARWDWSRRHANRMIEASETVDALGPMGPSIDSERQARELSGLAPDAAAEVVDVAKAGAMATRGAERPTAADLRSAREALARSPHPPRPPDRAPTPAPPQYVPPPESWPDRPHEEPAEEPSDADLDAQLDAALDETAVRFRRNFTAVMARADDVGQFDLDRAVEVMDHDSLNRYVGFWRRWCDDIEQRMRTTSHLRVVGGS